MLNDFLTLDNFLMAWEKVRRNKGCAGVDGQGIDSFERNIEQNLERLLFHVDNGSYRPLPLRQLFIPKKMKNGKVLEWRQLGVPTVRDRLVQQALLQVIHPPLEAEFEEVSYAYRPGRSHKTAVQKIDYWRERGYRWVMDADIVRYFDNVQHPRLEAELLERLPCLNGRLLDTLFLLGLIQGWLNSGILTKRGLVYPPKGLPQGAVISPILANVYLDDFDELVLESGLKLVRYADDFVILARHEGALLEAQQWVSQHLHKIGLQLHPEKTQITNFNRGFRFLGHTFVRSLVVSNQSKGRRQLGIERLLMRQETLSQSSHLQLYYADPPGSPMQAKQALVDAMKQAQQPIPPPLFVVLGYGVREIKPIKIESHELSWRAGMATLYLVEQGARLKKSHHQFVVQVPEEPDVEIPIREVERLLVFGNIQLTTSAISVCLEKRIPVVFLSQLGDYKGHLWSAELEDIEVEAAQFHKRNDARFRREMARAIVVGKLKNSRQLLLRLNRKRKSEVVATAIKGLRADITAVRQATRLDQIRGYEGAAAARYFGALGGLILNSEAFPFDKRTRRPPKDAVNSLLSFGYTLLYNNVLSLILAEGLNPYLGNLHRSARKETHLAFDLMEEFRSPIVDSLMITVLNRQVIKPTDFTWPDQAGGIYLNEAARRVFLREFEDRISTLISHRDLQEKVSFRRAIQLQVKRYKRCLLEDIAYEAFLRAV